MGTTTFSGPIKAGGISQTTGTTVGSDVRNVGSVMMVQSKEVDTTGASANTSIGVIPANSQIVAIHLDALVAADDTNPATLSIGTTTNATAFLSATNVKSVARTSTASYAASLALIADLGDTDVKVVGVFTGTDGDGTAGEALVTVEYVQNNDTERTFVVG